MEMQNYQKCTVIWSHLARNLLLPEFTTLQYNVPTITMSPHNKRHIEAVQEPSRPAIRMYKTRDSERLLEKHDSSLQNRTALTRISFHDEPEGSRAWSTSPSALGTGLRSHSVLCGYLRSPNWESSRPIHPEQSNHQATGHRLVYWTIPRWDDLNSSTLACAWTSCSRYTQASRNRELLLL